MLNLSNGKYLELFNGAIRECLSPEANLAKNRIMWNLDHLDLIVTTDTIQDDRKRKAIEHKKRRSGNIVMGAIVGGLLDGSEGDDSIVDGALLGAAFGAVATSGPESATAKVGLLFSDNESLTVEVDADEYSQLQTIAEQNARRGQFNNESSAKETPLTKDDMDRTLTNRALRQLKILLIAAVVIALGTSIAPYVASTGSPEEASGAAAMLKGSMSEIVKGLPYIGVGLGMLLVAAGFIGVIRPQIHLRENEKDLYESLAKNSTDAIEVRS